MELPAPGPGNGGFTQRVWRERKASKWDWRSDQEIVVRYLKRTMWVIGGVVGRVMVLVLVFVRVKMVLIFLDGGIAVVAAAVISMGFDGFGSVGVEWFRIEDRDSRSSWIELDIYLTHSPLPREMKSSFTNQRSRNVRTGKRCEGIQE